MILTDREWLRFMTFALAAGGALGTVTAIAFVLEGVPVVWALAGTVAWCGAIAVVVHLIARYLLDKATAPAPTDEPATEETA